MTLSQAPTKRRIRAGREKYRKDLREYWIWAGMNYRCRHPEKPSNRDYSGRGISVCPEWINSFEAFYAYVGPRPSPNHTLDRINNDGNYEPGNVRWATREQQANNKRPRHSRVDRDEVTRLRAGGLTFSEIGKVFGVSHQMISKINRKRIVA